jgi:hypothetical protein
VQEGRGPGPDDGNVGLQCGEVPAWLRALSQRCADPGLVRCCAPGNECVAANEPVRSRRDQDPDREGARAHVARRARGQHLPHAWDRATRTGDGRGDKAPEGARAQRASRPARPPSGPAVPGAVQQPADLLPSGGGGRGMGGRPSRRCAGDRRRRHHQRDRRLHPGRQGGAGARGHPQDDLAAGQRAARRSPRRRSRGGPRPATSCSSRRATACLPTCA